MTPSKFLGLVYGLNTSVMSGLYLFGVWGWWGPAVLALTFGLFVVTCSLDTDESA